MKQYPPADSVSQIKLIWNDYRPTELVELPKAARHAQVGRVFVKVEGTRPLGNFKILGGMTAALRALAQAAGVATLGDLHPGAPHKNPLPRLICASAGNHGLSVAMAAKRAGTHATIYLAEGANPARARRLQASGAEIIWIRGIYDDAVAAAAAAAKRGEGLLISDMTDDPNDLTVRDVMRGYLLIAQELAVQFHEQMNDRPTHLFIQAGVGGLAAAMAEGLQDLLQAPKKILVVEPESAACVARALQAGRPVRISADLKTSAEMLACAVASAPALEILQRHEAHSVLVNENQLEAAVSLLRQTGGPETTASGATGFAGLLHVASNPALRAEHWLDDDSKALLIATECPLHEWSPREDLI